LKTAAYSINNLIDIRPNLETTAMTTELSMLAWGSVLVLVQIVIQATLCSLDVGLPYALGPQDEGKHEQGVLARRARRALGNMLETFPIFAAVALALVVSNKAGGIAATGALIWFFARIAYLVVYLAGIPYARTLVWAASILGIAMMLFKLLG
jgi:uncharacterized MAPEG superfamily protein